MDDATPAALLLLLLLHLGPVLVLVLGLVVLLLLLVLAVGLLLLLPALLLVQRRVPPPPLLLPLPPAAAATLLHTRALSREVAHLPALEAVAALLLLILLLALHPFFTENQPKSREKQGNQGEMTVEMKQKSDKSRTCSGHALARCPASPHQKQRLPALAPPVVVQNSSF